MGVATPQYLKITIKNMQRNELVAQLPPTESFVPPDPPAAFVPEEVAPPYQSHSPERMALWLIQQITEKLNYAMEAGHSHAVHRNVERRLVMVGICRLCDERPELRMEVWSMMQSLSACQIPKVKMMNRRKFSATPRKCQICITTECFAKARETNALRLTCALAIFCAVEDNTVTLWLDIAICALFSRKLTVAYWQQIVMLQF